MYSVLHNTVVTPMEPVHYNSKLMCMGYVLYRALVNVYFELFTLEGSLKQSCYLIYAVYLYIQVLGSIKL